MRIPLNFELPRADIAVVSNVTEGSLVVDGSPELIGSDAIWLSCSCLRVHLDGGRLNGVSIGTSMAKDSDR